MKKRLKILIVDDDSTSRDLMGCFLEDFQGKDFAANGFDAVEKMMDAIKYGEPYDLVIQDISMPHMDGIQVVKILRAAESIAKTRNHTKVLMATGLTEEKTILEAFSAGADEYIMKPIQRDQLFEKLVRMNLGGMP